jgi:hypothetical protein
MDWLSNVISNLQKRILGDDEPAAYDSTAVRHLKERRALERVQQFQSRLHELDRRLARLK